LTVQAISHLNRQLVRRGYVETRNGLYRPTVAGVAWLHGTLAAIGADVQQRLERLHVVRSARALAATDLVSGAVVSLEMRNGILTARRGESGPARGIVRTSAHEGDLVEIGELEGIIPISLGEVRVFIVGRAVPKDPRVGKEISALIQRRNYGVLGAQGLEALRAVEKATSSFVQRFGVAATCIEAAHLGVNSLVFVAEEDLPRFLEAFSRPGVPPVLVARLGGSTQGL